ncbi:hypothetical protein [Breznakia pachnodae]|uniref:Phenylacetate-coenzyme A ligase PaaK-like adenylate-forming protein n=1 Tax=Breznakia pachnodae TaxID=265178 RepID=A0ABU0E401_9FIRM|nr:hypothetical protein [Breznakia pachnodae]MDQ0361530.1 phenylacetate-coenzyme A ligase PaaK-like adenylate-forming protein [Breznakia pachnodae]
MKIEHKQFNRNKEQIISCLHFASKTKYYMKLFQENEIIINKINTYEEFKKIPITNKMDYLENKLDFIREGMLNEKQYDNLTKDFSNYAEKDEILKLSSLNILITSGSTGIPLEVIRSDTDIFNNYRELNIYRRKHKNIIDLSNHVWVLPESIVARKYVFNSEEPIFQYTKYGYIACIDCLNPETYSNFIDFCEINKITAIISWPSFLEGLCDYISDFSKMKETVECINYFEVNSEYLSNYQREKIEKEIGTKILNVYSGNESNFIGVSINDDLFHLLDKNVFLELIPNANGRYETVITNLNSPDSSLIRYNLGDLAEWIDSNSRFKEKDGYPFLFKLVGCRENDHLLSKKNEKYEFNIVNDLIHFFQNKNQIFFGRYKVIQLTYENFIFKFSNTLTIAYSEELKTYLEENLKKILGYDVYFVVKKVGKWTNVPFKEKYRCFECQIKI